MVTINMFWFYQYKNNTDTFNGWYYMVTINMFWLYQYKNNTDIFNICWFGQHNIGNNTIYWIIHIKYILIQSIYICFDNIMLAVSDTNAIFRMKYNILLRIKKIIHITVSLKQLENYDYGTGER